MLPRLAPTALALLVLTLAGCKPKLTPAQKEQLTAALGGLRARGAEADAKRRKGLDAARSLVPRPDLGRCPIAVPVPPDMTRRRTMEDLSMVPARRLLEVETGEKDPWGGPKQGPLWRSLDHSVGSYETSLKYDAVEGYGKDPGAELLRRVGELEDPGTWQYDLYLLADAYVKPEIEGKGFTPGRLRGRLYVWSYPTAEVVCAAEASGASSSSLGTHTFRGVENIVETINVLRMDLEVETLRSALKQLYKAGPPAGG